MPFECTVENAAAVAARIRGEVAGIAVVQVTAIVEDVAERGDEALLEYEEQFSGNERVSRVCRRARGGARQARR